MDSRKKIALIQNEMQRLSNIALAQKWGVVGPNRILSVLLDNQLGRPWIDVLNPTMHPVAQLNLTQIDDLLSLGKTCATVPGLFQKLLTRSQQMHHKRFQGAGHAFVIRPRLGKKVGDVVYIRSSSSRSIVTSENLTFAPKELTLYPLSPLPSSSSPTVVAVKENL